MSLHDGNVLVLRDEARFGLASKVERRPQRKEPLGSNNANTGRPLLGAKPWQLKEPQLKLCKDM